MKHIIIAVWLVLTVAHPAFAVTWTFDNATYTRETASSNPLDPGLFTELGTITGSFDYDAVSNIYSNVSVTFTRTSPDSPLVETFSSFAPINDSGVAFPPITFTPANATQTYFRAASDPTMIFLPFMSFLFADPLTQAGGTVGLAAWRDDSCDFATCTRINAISISRFSVSGSIVAPTAPSTPIPLPAGLPLLVAGLGGLAIVRSLKRGPASRKPLA